MTFETADAIEGAEVIVARDVKDGEGELMAVDKLPLIIARVDCQSSGYAFRVKAHSHIGERLKTDGTPISSRTKNAGSRYMMKTFLKKEEHAKTGSMI